MDKYEYDIIHNIKFAFTITKEILINKIRFYNFHCIYCNYKIKVYWCNKYSGLRGKCDTCDNNWPES
jgi:hypothetical protein